MSHPVFSADWRIFTFSVAVAFSFSQNSNKSWSLLLERSDRVFSCHSLDNVLIFLISLYIFSGNMLCCASMDLLCVLWFPPSQKTVKFKLDRGINGLDAIIKQFLNQFENTDPPPAGKK